MSLHATGGEDMEEREGDGDSSVLQFGGGGGGGAGGGEPAQEFTKHAVTVIRRKYE